MKFDKQVDVLRAFSVASRDGLQPVDGDALARLTKVSAATVALDNNFFMESGLITRVRKGQYLPVAEVNEFRRKWSFDQDPKAAHILAPILAKNWYYQALEVYDEMAMPTQAEAVKLLADHAGADESYTPQIEMLLDWLEFVGLIDITDGMVGVEPVGLVAPPKPSETPSPADAGGKGASSTSTPPAHQGREAPAVLTWSFAVRLTADDIAKFSPEQIKAVFEAAGTVAAVKPSD